MMVTVFIAGSRAISRLNSDIRKRLSNIVNQHFKVLVGDANGADKAIQKYLAELDYRDVVVHCMDVCRNNLGHWPTQRHEAPGQARRDRHYYGIKDLAMARDATCGFMLWDGDSKGTLTNTINLLDAHKKVLLYVSPKKSFCTLRKTDDLHQVLLDFGIKNIPALLTSLGVREPNAGGGAVTSSALF